MYYDRNSCQHCLFICFYVSSMRKKTEYQLFSRSFINLYKSDISAVKSTSVLYFEGSNDLKCAGHKIKTVWVTEVFNLIRKKLYLFQRCSVRTC